MHHGKSDQRISFDFAPRIKKMGNGGYGGRIEPSGEISPDGLASPGSDPDCIEQERAKLLIVCGVLTIGGITRAIFLRRPRCGDLECTVPRVAQDFSRSKDMNAAEQSFLPWCRSPPGNKFKQAVAVEFRIRGKR